MSNLADYKLSIALRITGIEPDEVTKSLGLNPTTARWKGERRLGRSGRRYSNQPHHLWLLHEKRASLRELSPALAKLASLLEPRAEQLRAIASRALVVDIFVGLFAPEANLGLSIDPAVLLSLGRLNLTLELDIYLASGDANEAEDEGLVVP